MDPEYVDGKDGGVLRQNCAKLNKVLIRTEQHQPPQPQLQSHHKKQVRRRYHATRSYQGRVLNMAEARREIVAALKIHRASMKAAEQQKKQQQLPLQQDVSSPSVFTEESHKEIKSRRSTRIYPPNTTTDTLSSFEGNSCQSISYPPHFPWASCTTREVGKLSGDLNITSPNLQPLGLHINLHNFNNIGVTSNNNGINSSIFCSSSSPSLSPSSTSSSSLTSSYASAVVSSPKISSCVIEQIGSCETSKEHVVQTLHPAMDDERMAEIRLIGEQHDMEWNDKLNMATLAWWCKFLKSSEMGSLGLEENIAGGKEDNHDFLNEVMDVPSWICNQQQFDNYNPDIGYSQQAAALQCLDTGDTKEMDGGWLS